MEWTWLTSLIKPIVKLIGLQKGVEINNKVGVLHFQYENIAMPVINEIEIGLLAINKNSDIRILTDFEAKFYDGQIWHNLNFDFTKIPPFEKIEPKSPKEIRFNFILPDKISLPVLDIQISHIELRYKIGKKRIATFMDEIKLIESQSPYTWVAF